jgi:CHAT domain-containing protein/tetratricopeptide (TPR) repeat protein
VPLIRSCPPGWTALAGLAALLLLPRAAGAEGADVEGLRAERDAADAVWAGGSPLVARERFVELAARLEDEDDLDAVFLRASLEARLGTLSRELGRLDEAKSWWGVSLGDYQDAGKFGSAATILGNLAAVENEQGRSDVAVDWLTEAIELQRAFDRPRLAALALYQRATVLRARGDFGPALADLAEAIDAYTEFGEIEPGGRDRPWFLYCRGFVAEFVLRLGEPRVAADELARILDDPALDDPRLAAEWRLLEASAWARSAEPERAEDALLRARQAIEDAGLDGLASALLRIEGDVALFRGDLDEACSRLEDSWDVAVQMGLVEQQILSGGSWAHCLNEAGDPRRAALVGRDTRLLAEASGSKQAWQGWYQEARALEALGEADEAAAAYAEAADLLVVVLEDLQLDTLAMGRWRLDFDGVFDGAAATRLAVARGPEDVEAALDLVEQGRSRLLLDAVLGGRATAPDPASAPEEDEVSGLPGPTRRALGRLRRLPTQEGRPWLERLRLRAPRADDGDPGLRRSRSMGAATVSVAALRRRLPRTMGVAIFRTGERGGDVFWVERDRVEAWPLALDEAAMTALVDRFLSLMARSVTDASARPAFDAASAELRAAALGPIEQRLRGMRQLVVVPDGALYRVPFAALAADGRYLLEQATVSVAPSLNILDALLDRSPDTLTTFVGVADPRADLPRARGEVEDAAARFGRHTVLAGEDASLPRLLASLDGADVLHFATHGELEGGGEPSWLALTGDGALDAEAILDLELDLPLVTLSACRSARGSQQAGEALVNSLARSFLAAGAESVVGSLWDVHDGSTAELMGRFYESLGAGAFVADGLADAQRGMALSGGPYAHPWYWAGFEVIGDPR